MALRRFHSTIPLARLPPIHIRSLPSAQKILEEEQHQRDHADPAEKRWRNFFYFACVPGMILMSFRAYTREMHHLEHIEHEVRLLSHTSFPLFHS